MSFLSFSFAAFLVVVVALYWGLPLRLRKPFLLLSSMAFYAVAYPPHAALIFGLVIICYGVGTRLPIDHRGASRLAIDHRGASRLAIGGAGAAIGGPGEGDRGRVGFVVSIVFFVGVLAYYKYARLLLSTLADLGGPRLASPDVRIPLGISFFTFEFIHYLTDIRLGKIRDSDRRGRFLDFSLFALYFPTLLSGPIKRYQNFLSEGEAHTRFRAAYVAEGLCRIVIGVGKKVVVADSMTALSSRLLTPDLVTPTGLWVAMYAYAVKIYFDFSGYSDIAIGISRLFGYRVPENFDNPYLRRNLSIFWRHWHMSLSSWIRDYLFIPLGGSRVSPLRAAVNLTFVMAVCGLWHGASWNFVAWGLWHGVGLAVLRGYEKLEGRFLRFTVRPAWLGAGVSMLVTIQYVCLGWILFATPTMHVALVAYARMFGLQR